MWHSTSSLGLQRPPAMWHDTGWILGDDSQEDAAVAGARTGCWFLQGQSRELSPPDNLMLLQPLNRTAPLLFAWET